MKRSVFILSVLFIFGSSSNIFAQCSVPDASQINLLSPVGNAVADSTTPVFSWTAAPNMSSSSDYYEFYLWDTADNSHPVPYPVSVSSTSWQLAMGSLTRGHSYAWKLRPVNSCGAGNYTATANFSVNTTPGNTTTTVNTTNVTADFYASPTTGLVPLDVIFTNLSKGNIASYEWDFGDVSEKSTEENPLHTYQKTGVYSVRLTVTGTDGSKDTKIKENYITAAECPFKSTLDNSGYIDTLHILRDKHFNNFYGKLVTSIFYHNAAEISSILSTHPELQARLRELVADNFAIAEELIHKGTAHLPQRNADEITAFLNEIAKDGSLKLKFYTALVIKGIEYRIMMNGIGLTIN